MVTNFDQLESGVTKAVQVTDQGITVVNQVDGTLPALTVLCKNAQAAVATTKEVEFPKIKLACGVVQNATDAGLTQLSAANTSCSAVLTTCQQQLQQLDSSKDTAAQ